MKKGLKFLNSTFFISLLFLSSCNSKKYSQITDSSQPSSPLLEIDYTKLMAPQNLSFDPSQNVLKWDSVDGAFKYELNVDGQILSSSIDKTNYTLPSHLFNDEDKKQYYMSIRAVNEDGTIKSNYTTFLYDVSNASLSSPYTYEYEEEKNEYIINGLNPFFDLNNDSNLVLSEEFNDIPITGIAPYAFENEKKLIKSMTLSSNIKTIGNNAFSGCYIASIVLNEGLVEIGDFAFEKTIKLGQIKIPSTVTNIGNSAFYMSAITSLTISDNSKIESIGESAFMNTGIEALNLPASIKQLGEKAFYRSKIKSLTFEEGTTLSEIPAQCFASCTNLTSLSLPASVSKIGSSSFSSCSSLRTVLIANDSSIQTIEESAFENLSRLTYFGLEENYDSTSSATILNIPDTLEIIGDKAFRNIKFTQINFGNASILNQIGENAFSGNTSLTNIRFPKSLVTIGKSAFSGNTALANVYFTDDSLLRYVGKDAFSNCPFITNAGDQRIMVAKVLYAISSSDQKEKVITLDSSILAIAEEVFSKCEVETLNLNEGLEVIGNGAFLNCSSLKNVSIPNSVIVIGNNAFQNCSAMQNLNFGNVVSASLQTIGNYAFNNVYEVLNINLPNNVTTIGNNAFACTSSYVSGSVRGNAKLTSFIINASSQLQTIGENAFSGQVSLTDINIPNQVNELHNSAFYNCASLRNITIDKENSKIERFGTSVFENSGITNINIPASTKTIESNAFKNCKALENVDFSDSAFSESPDKTLYQNTFEGCSSLRSITLPSSIETIQANAFLNATNLETIITSAVNIDNLSFTNTAFESNAENGFVICNGIIIRYVGTDKEIVLPEGIIGINPSAFSNSSVEIITISNTLKTIDDSAFENCSNLKVVKFGNDSMLTEIGTRAFMNCKNLEEFTFSDDITSIGAYAFYNCISLKSANLTSSHLQVIEEYTFTNCNSLTQLTLGSNIREIKKYAFYQNSLEEIDFPDSMIIIGDYAFARNGKALNNLLAPENWEITTPSLQSIHFNDNSKLSSIGKYTFANNYISEIELPKNEGLFLDEYCFVNSVKLLRFTLEEGIVITEGIVSGATQLEEMEIPSEISLVSLFGGQVSMVPKTLKTVYFSEGSQKVNDYALAGLGMIENVILPSTITEIGAYAFYGCRSISSIDLSNIKIIDQNAFNGCTKLSTIVFGTQFEYIGNKALFATQYLNELESEFVIIDGILIRYNGNDKIVTLPNNVTMIAGGAFSGNQDIEKVILSENTSYIGNGAFDSCFNLESVEIQYDGLIEIELGTFDTLSSNLSIFVSNQNLNAYKTDIFWSLYADYLKAK